jgi:hypothetical protein
MTNNILTLNLPFIRPLSFLNIKSGSFRLMGVCFIVFLVGFYVFQINALTGASFRVNSLQRQLATSKESKNLEINYSGMSSLASLEGLAGTSAYEKVDKIYYIQMVENTMAKK